MDGGAGEGAGAGRGPFADDDYRDADGGGGDDGDGGPSSVEAQADDDELLGGPDDDLDVDVGAMEVAEMCNDVLRDFDRGAGGVNAPSCLEGLCGSAGRSVDKSGIVKKYVDDVQTNNNGGGAEAPADPAQNPAGSGLFADMLTSTLMTLNAGEKEDGEGNVLLEDGGGVPGICGLTNIGNTCYMNAGLQCLLSTPPVVHYFLESFTPIDIKKEPSDIDVVDSNSKDCCPPAAMAVVKRKKENQEITNAFAPLASRVWCGDFKSIKPSAFKEVFGKANTEFQGCLQHDCQEFLALLLDGLHDELHSDERNGSGLNKLFTKSECNTSMELHSSMSMDRDLQSSTVVGAATSRMTSWIPEQEAATAAKSSVAEVPLLVKAVTSATQQALAQETDGNESPGSPRSYDSQSSVDDKVSSAIRNRPIPKELKLVERCEEEEMIALDEDTMDSTSSSINQPTSNLVAPDSLKKGTAYQMDQVNDTVEAHSNAPHSLEDLINKDNKTLNVNVLADGEEDQLKNNELNFDSEKFCKRRSVEKNTRPKETIDNLSSTAANETADSKSTVSQQELNSLESKKLQHNCNKHKMKTNNMDVDISVDVVEGAISNGNENSVNGVNGGPEDGFEYSAIKRMRLDSSDREKNVRMAARQQQQLLQHRNLSPSEGVREQIDEEDEPASDGVENGTKIEVDEGESCSAALSQASGASALVVNGGQSLVDTRDLKEAIEAERYWEKYLASNDTVVARTFQGLFKNTIVCSICQFTSVTFEPFMYLAVPLPMAMVLQLEVTFVSATAASYGKHPATTYLVEMTQADNIGSLKTELCRLLLEDDSGGVSLAVSVNELVAVEQCNHRIHRILEDWLLLRHIQENQSICVIQKIATAEADKEPEPSAPNSLFPGPIPLPMIGPMPLPSPAPLENGNLLPSTSGFGELQIGDVGALLPETTTSMLPTPPEDAAAAVTAEATVAVTACGDAQQPQQPESGDSGGGAGLVAADEVIATEAIMAVDESKDDVGGAGEGLNCPGNLDASKDVPLLAVAGQENTSNGNVAAADHVQKVPDDLSCVICMEELQISEVRQHNACTCIMCPGCLERALEHHEQGDNSDGGAVKKGYILCPGCREEAHPATEFVPLSQIGVSKPKKKTYNSGVMMRIEDEHDVTMFGYPFMIRTQNQVFPSELFGLVLSLLRLPEDVNAPFSLVLVDSTGKWCSRCLLAERCRGCHRLTVPDASFMANEAEVLLQAGDNFAINFMAQDLGEAKERLVEAHMPFKHSSMERERQPERLSLEACLEAFSESEVLDENNPFSCPVCRKRQVATKTLTIWKLPDFLIIYLKRFVYAKESSCKLEKAVSFPVGDLDLTRFMSGPLRSEAEQTRFDLYACVNHIGSVGSGHYTAFCKHGPRQQWHLYNDSDVQSDKLPGQSLHDQKAAYVLFYERKGASKKYVLPGVDSPASNCEEMKESSCCPIQP